MRADYHCGILLLKLLVKIYNARHKFNSRHDVRCNIVMLIATSRNASRDLLTAREIKTYPVHYPLAFQ